MASQYSIEVLRIVVAQICQTIGWHAIQSTPLNIMVDILHKYIIELGKNAQNYAIHFGHTTPNLDDVGLAFRDSGVQVEDLCEYIGNVEAVQFPHTVPKYPVARESHLNFLKPGSREVLTRPVHVHEHLPPMHPQLEDEEKAVVLAALSVDTSGGGTDAPSPASPKGTGVGGFKRPGDTEHHSAKRARLMMEEEGRPVREISSVMMTTSGFLSPAREGKLPEARTPAGADPASRSASPSPSPSCYPTVPPDVKGDKKPKKPVVKKQLGETDKEPSAPKKKESKESGKAEKSDEPKVKKLVSMKEFAKLKALKAGAMKQMAAIVPPVNLGGLGKIPKIGASRPTDVKSPKGKIGPASPKSVTPEKARDVGLIEGKLSSEPDKQKLNIFKKISKVKEDKVDVGDSIAEVVPSRESSPGLVIDETELSGRRDSRMAKIETCIDAVIQAAADSKSPASESESDHESPGTDRIRERDRESASPAPEPRRKERKKKRDRSKSKRGVETETPLPVSRPKTPEVSDISRPPVFPFFTHFPPAPGLIPPPIGHPFFPGFPMQMGKNMPHPAMPNMPMPPARLMHRTASPPLAAPEIGAPVTPTPRSAAAGDSSREGEKLLAKPAEKSPEKPVEKTPEKTPEKKTKEHKKEKKEKDKTKKKKDKKDKLKGKERGEKKKTKEEKREKNKSKEKKEKKEKRKEKERDEKMEGSVPKITLRLSASSPRPPTPDAPVPVRRITIKPVVKTIEPGQDTSASASTDSAIAASTRDPSPELARMCALVTRPAKKSSSKTSGAAPRPPDPPPPLSASPPPLPRPPPPRPTGRSKGEAGSSQMEEPLDRLSFYHDNSGNKVWICPACGGQDDGSPMIGCDDCDAWYHWVCVGIQVPPDENEDWYCRVCIVKKQEHVSDKSKKKRRKKMLAP